VAANKGNLDGLIKTAFRLRNEKRLGLDHCLSACGRCNLFVREFLQFLPFRSELHHFVRRPAANKLNALVDSRE